MYAYTNTIHLFVDDDKIFITKSPGGGDLATNKLTFFRTSPKRSDLLEVAYLKPARGGGFLVWSGARIATPDDCPETRKFLDLHGIRHYHPSFEGSPGSAPSDTPVLQTPKESRMNNTGMCYVSSEAEQKAWDTLYSALKTLPGYFRTNFPRGENGVYLLDPWDHGIPWDSGEKIL